MPTATHAHTTSPICGANAPARTGWTDALLRRAVPAATGPLLSLPSAPTRRTLGASALAVLTGGGLATLFLSPNPDWSTPARAAMVPADPDAELLRLIAEAEAIDAESDRLWAASADFVDRDHPAVAAYERHAEATRARRHELLESISQTPARTPEGRRGKARLVRSLVTIDTDGQPCGDSFECLTWSLVNDVLAGRA